MIYCVVLTYTRPVEEVNQQLDAHKAWLVANVQQGRIILAGPLVPPTGGMVLAACADAGELEAMMAQDPFIAHELAEYRVLACAPALACAEFPARWAEGARFI